VGGYTWQSWPASTDGINTGGFPNDNMIFYNMRTSTIVNKPQTTTTQLVFRLDLHFETRQFKIASLFVFLFAYQILTSEQI
jgi:hypothetical protein